MICPVLKLAQQLIQQPSVSPNDHGCQTILINRLKKLVFQLKSCPLTIPPIYGHIMGNKVKR